MASEKAKTCMRTKSHLSFAEMAPFSGMIDNEPGTCVVIVFAGQAYWKDPGSGSATGRSDHEKEISLYTDFFFVELSVLRAKKAVDKGLMRVKGWRIY